MNQFSYTSMAQQQDAKMMGGLHGNNKAAEQWYSHRQPQIGYDLSMDGSGGRNALPMGGSENWTGMSTPHCFFSRDGNNLVPSPTESTASCSSNNDELEDSSSSSSYQRASKRIRLTSPPRPSMQNPRRRLLTPRPSMGQVSCTKMMEDPTGPPDIQRLALPDLIHSSSAPAHGFCPFGTLP